MLSMNFWWSRFAKAACTIADTTHIQDEVAPDYGDAYYEYEDWD